LSDSFREKLGSGASVIIDGRKTGMELGPEQLIEIPGGLGSHKIDIGTKQ